MTRATAQDERWMRRAVELAARGRGRVEPNPPVGAVIVRGEEIVGEGWHQVFGGPHAEVEAIESAGAECRGATLYVTLEPCTGRNKKTPPCSEAVIAAGFARVVIGARDPTQAAASPALEAAGIEVSRGVLEKECPRLIAPFLKLKQRGMPWVIAKWAMTADGKTATVTGESKWISSEPSRQLVQGWRNEVDAVVAGAGTVRRDDPLLTCRIAGGRNPKRIVVDSGAALPLDSALVRSVAEAPVIVACAETAPEERCRRLSDAGVRVLRCPEREGRVELADLLKALGAEQMTNLLVEGGGRLMGELFDRQLVDEVRLFIAPKLFGGASAATPVAGAGIESPSQAILLENLRRQTVGGDLLLWGDVRYSG